MKVKISSSLIVLIIISIFLLCSTPANAVQFTYTLSGGLSSSTKLVVDNDITVYVNGKAVFVDNDRKWTGDSGGCSGILIWRRCWPGAIYRGDPITFQASPGDTIRIVATNPGRGYIQLSPLYLHAEGQSTKLTNGVQRQSSDIYNFFDQSFTITIPSGSLSISSIPSGANVYVDENYKGTTPLSVDNVLSGSHTVKVTKVGYNDEIKAVSVGAGQTINLDIVLIPQTGSISVYSNPSGASVYLDGSYKGTTPITIPNVPIGSHTVLLKKSDYHEVSKTINVKSDQTAYISESLILQTGSIKISSDPIGAEVYFDGTYKGKTPITITKVSIGTHTLVLKKFGYADWSQSVNIQVDRTLDIETRTLSVICPVLKRKEIDVRHWEQVTDDLIKAEENIKELSVPAENLFNITSRIIKDSGMFMLKPEITSTPQLFNGFAMFYAEGVSGLRYAAYVEVVGG
ncbi:MAG: PEGA domain-containing protein, partial [Methanosarcinales archaeon]